MQRRIGITMGDPKGIGPEVLVRAWAQLTDAEREQLLLYGDRAVLSAAMEIADVHIDPKRVVVSSSTSLPLGDVSNAEAARTAIAALDAALDDIEGGRIEAIVTGPINKHRVRTIKPEFIGHTEYLAHNAEASDAVMMFCAEACFAGNDLCPARPLCVSLVTTHLPLGEVPEAITHERLLNVLRKTHQAMDGHFACPDARIAVMGLNPHAGEEGMLGDEEERIIRPTVEAARQEGINCEGPYPADSLFNDLKNFSYDAIVAMYHDQGLLPVKLLCQGTAVNVTLGLPYIRTSPGHGTAEDKAWQGRADPQNMLSAIRLTRRLLGWRVDE